MFFHGEIKSNNEVIIDNDSEIVYGVYDVASKSYSFSNKITIYVPESYVASYKATTPWNECTIYPS